MASPRDKEAVAVQGAAAMRDDRSRARSLAGRPRDRDRRDRRRAPRARRARPLTAEVVLNIQRGTVQQRVPIHVPV